MTQTIQPPKSGLILIVVASPIYAVWSGCAFDHPRTIWISASSALDTSDECLNTLPMREVTQSIVCLGSPRWETCMFARVEQKLRNRGLADIRQFFGTETELARWVKSLPAELGETHVNTQDEVEAILLGPGKKILVVGLDRNGMERTLASVFNTNGEPKIYEVWGSDEVKSVLGASKASSKAPSELLASVDLVLASSNLDRSLKDDLGEVLRQAGKTDVRFITPLKIRQVIAATTEACSLRRVEGFPADGKEKRMMARGDKARIIVQLLAGYARKEDVPYKEVFEKASQQIPNYKMSALYAAVAQEFRRRDKLTTAKFGKKASLPAPAVVEQSLQTLLAAVESKLREAMELIASAQTKATLLESVEVTLQQYVASIQAK